MAEVEAEPQGIDPLAIHIGKRLKRCRNSQHISQADLGKYLNLSFQQIQKYENGRNRISSPCLYRLSVILKIPVSWFFEGYEEPTLKDYPLPHQDIPTQQEIDKLLQHFHSIPTAKTRSVVIDLVELHAKVAKF